MLGRGDDGALAPALDELHRGADLRSHAALGELARLEIATRFRHGEAIEEALGGRAEGDGDLLHARGDHEVGRTQVCGEKARGEVLVHHRLHAPVHAGRLLHHGDAAAAAGDDQEARLEEGGDRSGLHDPHRTRRGHEAAIATACVFDEDPAIAPTMELRFLTGVAASDGLRGVLEGWIVTVDHRLGEQAGDAIRHAPPSQLAHQRVAEDVADATLGVGHAHVEREVRSELRLGDELGAAEDEAHLRPVAVGEDDAPAPRGEGAHVDGGGAGVLALLVDGAALALADERVAAHRDDHSAAGLRYIGTPSRRPNSRRASAKQASGALAMPAPTWPTPASRWAMPVLKMGAIPLSTTRRASMPVGVPAKPRAGMP